MLKKSICLYVIFCIVCFAFIYIPSNNLVFANILKDRKEYTYQFFCSSKQNFNYENVVNVGFGSIVTANQSNVNKIASKVSNVQGQSVSFVGDEKTDVQNILLTFNASVVKIQNFNNMQIVYAYSTKLEKCVYDEDVINLQICFNNGIITVGYPIIMGSY